MHERKKKTKCVEPSGNKTFKNERKMFWCTCASRGIKKYRFCKFKGKLISPSHKEGIADTALGIFVAHGIPWMAKKSVEMGWYAASELMRNKKMQKKAIDYALDKLNPMTQNVGSQALD